MNLGISHVDLVIVVVYLLGVVLFGLWIGRGQKDVSGYLLGGRDLPWWGVLLSIVATETSTVTFLSIPGVAFDPKGGSLVFLQLTLGYIAGRFIVVFLLLPHYFRGELFTSYQVLHRRFGGATKQAASLLFLVTRNLADGLRLFLTAIVLEYVTGLDLWICIVVIGLGTILYTFFGGMKSVVWNDCIQFVVYILGAVLAGGVILVCLGGGWTQSADWFTAMSQGWARLTDFALEHDKFRLFDFSLDPTRPYTLWAGLFGGAFVALASHGTDQLMVQRYLSAGSLKKAGRALALSGFVVCGQFALFLLIGVGLACFYSMPEHKTVFEHYDRVFPAFMVSHLPVGVVGIIVAAVFSAAMSTLSSSLNSSAAAAVNDFYVPMRKDKPSPRQLLRVSRLLTVVFGLVQIGVAIASQNLAETDMKSVVVTVMAIAGFTSGVILGVFFLGVFTKRVSQQGALIGLVGGLCVMTAVVFVIPAIISRPLLAWPWFAVLGSFATVVIGLLADLVLRDARHANNN